MKSVRLAKLVLVAQTCATCVFCFCAALPSRFYPPIHLASRTEQPHWTVTPGPPTRMWTHTNCILLGDLLSKWKPLPATCSTFLQRLVQRRLHRHFFRTVWGGLDCWVYGPWSGGILLPILADIGEIDRSSCPYQGG